MTLKPSECRFAHAVNTPELLSLALGSDATFLEVDVILGPDGLDVAMGHDPGHFSMKEDGHVFLFKDLVAEIERHGAGKIGLKVDIKEWRCTQAVLEVLNGSHTSESPLSWPLLQVSGAHGASVSVPALMINADVLTGPNSGTACRFNSTNGPLSREQQIREAIAWVAKVGAVLPHAILSLGWTTVREGTAPLFDDLGQQMSPAPATYTASMIEAMRQVVGAFPGMNVTLAVKATMVPHCFKSLESGLMKPFPSLTLTLWDHRASTPEESDFYRRLPTDRVMFDLPEGSSSSTWPLETNLLFKPPPIIWAFAGAAIGIAGVCLISWLRKKPALRPSI